VAEQMNSEGLSVSLDLLGEEVHDEESALQATEDYLDCLDRVAQSSLDANVSVKPTRLGLPIDAGLPMEAIDRLASRANEVGTTVTLTWRLEVHRGHGRSF
jgi:proline dehydrogenase